MVMITFLLVFFQEAVKLVQPSPRREGFLSIPNVKWEDVGGLNLLRQEFEQYIVRRIKYLEDYEVICYEIYMQHFLKKKCIGRFGSYEVRKIIKLS